MEFSMRGVQNKKAIPMFPPLPRDWSIDASSQRVGVPDLDFELREDCTGLSEKTVIDRPAKYTVFQPILKRQPQVCVEWSNDWARGFASVEGMFEVMLVYPGDRIELKWIDEKGDSRFAIIVVEQPKNF